MELGHTAQDSPELLAKRTKKADDPLKLVIVCDMWLTGFDAPCMHTMYRQTNEGSPSMRLFWNGNVDAIHNFETMT